MSVLTKPANDVFAPYASDGTARSPSPQEAQVWGTEVERLILAFQAGGGIIFPSKATMDATLTYAANQQAWVMGDATVSNNGVYRKIGASGAGSWTRMGDLPYSFIVATDVGAGTANAIQATSSIPVSPSALVVVNIFRTNTASPVTISLNGGAALTVKAFDGADIIAAGLASGMVVAGFASGSTFRLISDQSRQALIAAINAAVTAAANSASSAAASATDSNAAKSAAQAARDLAQQYAADAASVSGVNVPIYASVTSASGSTIVAGVKAIETQFFAPSYAVPATLVGGAKYKRVATQPTHELKFRSVDRFLPDGSTSAGNGGWWEIDELEISITMAGATTDAADNKAAIDRAAAAAVPLNRPLVVPGGIFKTTGNHSWNAITVKGLGRDISWLISTNTNPASWVLRLGDISHVTGGLLIGYDAAVVTAGATRGQFVGFYSGNTGHPLCKGASIEGLSVRHAGTAFYDAVDPTFSATFFNIEIRDFTFAAIDFTSNSRTQNTFIQIYAGRYSGGRNNSTYVYNFEGSDDTGSTFDGLNAESTMSESAFRFRNVHATVMNFHAEDWVSKTSDCQLFDFDRSSGKIGRASVYYSVLKANCTLFRLGSAKYQEGPGPTQTPNAGLSIDILSIKDLTSDEARTQPVTNSAGVTLFRRTVTEALEGAIFVDVGLYIFYTVFGATDEAWYSSFAFSGDIRFVRKGQMIQSGPTAERPTGARRNPYLSRFYDTTANAELIYHPSLGWIPSQGNIKRLQALSASGTIIPEAAVVLVNATSASVVLTLPKTPGAALSRELTVRRVDNTANTVTFAAASGDTIGAISVPGFGTKRLITDGFTAWLEV